MNSKKLPENLSEKFRQLIRAKADHEPLDLEDLESHEHKWLVSYSDLMTLLFGFFVLLHSTAETADPQRAPAASTSAPAPSASASPSPGPSGQPAAQGNPEGWKLILTEELNLLRANERTLRAMLADAEKRLKLMEESLNRASKGTSPVYTVSSGSTTPLTAPYFSPESGGGHSGTSVLLAYLLTQAGSYPAMQKWNALAPDLISIRTNVDRYNFPKEFYVTYTLTGVAHTYGSLEGRRVLLKLKDGITCNGEPFTFEDLRSCRHRLEGDIGF